MNAATAADQTALRARLAKILGLPPRRVPLEPESRGVLERDGVVIEKWLWTSEPGSRVPSLLYRPLQPGGKRPAVVLTCGHGGSKSQPYYQYVAQLYAKTGLACLALDPIGEEERHIEGRLGTRAHDPEPVHRRADHAGRLIIGKMVFDTLRGLDFLRSRDDIDPSRLAVAGNSLGGAVAGWLLALEPALRAVIVSGWAFDDSLLEYGKCCTRVPNRRLREVCAWPEFLELAAPQTAVLVMNGDDDPIIDQSDPGVWRRTAEHVRQAARAYPDPTWMQCWFEPHGGHRPYHGYKDALLFLNTHLGTPAMSREELAALPAVNFGAWCDREGIALEKLYNTTQHNRGATLPDLNVRPFGIKELACLSREEVGSPAYTLEGWLDAYGTPSEWIKSEVNPLLCLGPAGAFDAHNILAPHVIHTGERWFMFYAGGPSGPANGGEYERYQLGLALSEDGVRWEKTGAPLLPLGARDDFHVTPALLRDGQGRLVLREGRWQMVYCGNRADDIEWATSADGLSWRKEPASPVYRGAYAPNLVQFEDEVRMYYVHKPDGENVPWELHLARGRDLANLLPHHANPILRVSQSWEKGALFYPFVVQEGDTWIMMYGAYWAQAPGEDLHTALGLAYSRDGLSWTKAGANPVFTPTPGSAYDSRYTSSHSLLRAGDAWRLYYASRVDMIHKYFAIGMATKHESLFKEAFA